MLRLSLVVLAIGSLCGCSCGGSAPFSLSVQPAAVTLAAGQSTTVALALTRHGFKDDVVVALANLPEGVTASAVTLSNGATSGALSLSAAASAPANSVTVLVEAVGGGASSGATLALTVSSATPDFAFSVSPAAATVTVGGTTSVNVLVDRQGGFAGAVGISLTSPTPGVSVPALTLPPDVSNGVLTVTVDGSAAVGTVASLVLTATSGSTSHTAPLMLTVVGPTGALDDSFGGAGFAIAPFPSTLPSFYASVAAQADGKLVVVGWTALEFDGGFGQSHFMTARYQTDGTLDPTYGNQGVNVISFSAEKDDERAAGIAIQPDGKILVAGTSRTGDAGVLMARFDTSGALDPTFGGTGAFVTPAVGVFQPTLALQSTGEIAVGADMLGHLAVVHYEPDGGLDTAFGDAGFAYTSIQQVLLPFEATIAIQSDDKIVVAGTAQGSAQTGMDFAAERLLTNGGPDSTFGDGGLVTVDFFQGADYARGIAIQPDGKIVLGGVATQGTAQGYAAVRLNTDGTLDTTFGTGGMALIDIDDDDANGVTLASDGRIVLCGTSQAFPSMTELVFELSIVRLTPAGAPDSTWGADGRVLTSFPYQTDSYCSSVITLPDGRMAVTGGVTNQGGTTAGVLSRYWP